MEQKSHLHLEFIHFLIFSPYMEQTQEKISVLNDFLLERTTVKRSKSGNNCHCFYISLPETRGIFALNCYHVGIFHLCQASGDCESSCQPVLIYSQAFIVPYN